MVLIQLKKELELTSWRRSSCEHAASRPELSFASIPAGWNSTVAVPCHQCALLHGTSAYRQAFVLGRPGSSGVPPASSNAMLTMTVHAKGDCASMTSLQKQQKVVVRKHRSVMFCLDPESSLQ